MKNAIGIGSLLVTLAAAGAVYGQAANPAIPAAPATPAHSQFDAVDANKDGRVSQAEARAHTELQSAFATLDADKDTYLSQSEFAKFKAGSKDKSQY